MCGSREHNAGNQERNASHAANRVSDDVDVTAWDDSDVPDSGLCAAAFDVNAFSDWESFPEGDVVAAIGNAPNHVATVGIDSCASISVVNDEKYFLTEEPETKPITLADDTVVTPKLSGLVQVELLGEDGNVCSAQVKACLVPGCKFNLISLKELNEDGFGCVMMPKTDPYLIKNDLKIPLKWMKGLLCGRIIPPKVPVCRVSSRPNRVTRDEFMRLHRVLGHVSAKTLEKMFDLKKPDEFDCSQCKAFYIRSRRPQPSSFV